MSYRSHNARPPLAIMPVTLDEVDLAIVELVQTDPRMAYADIAAAVGVSRGTVRNRLGRLRDSGALNIMAWVLPSALGFGALLTVGVAVEIEHRNDIIEALKEIPEVSFIATVTGDEDLVVDIHCRDYKHAHDAIIDKIQRLRGVTRTSSRVVLAVHRAQAPDPRALRS